MVRRWLPTAAAAVGVAWLGVSTALAVAAGRPFAAAAAAETRTPEAVGLPYRDVSYGPDRRAWWIEAGPQAPAIVLVHGYGARRGTEFEPGLELAALFHRWGYSSLILDLGYVTGAHSYSGGPLEADDVRLAIEWVRQRSPALIALWGSSAGGHAALLATGLGAPVSAVITDSAFVDARRVVTGQLARITRLPERMFSLVPVVMGWLTPPGPTDLRRALTGRTSRVPALHIHGTADTAVPISDVAAIAELTGGIIWRVPGGEHNQAFFADPEGYRDRIHSFLESNLRENP